MDVSKPPQDDDVSQVTPIRIYIFILIILTIVVVLLRLIIRRFITKVFG